MSGSGRLPRDPGRLVRAIVVDGRPVTEAAPRRAAAPDRRGVCELLVERRPLRSSCVSSHVGNEENVRATMAAPVAHRSAATGSSSATGRTRAAGGRSRATSPSTCASSGSSASGAVQSRQMTSLPGAAARLSPTAACVRPGMAARRHVHSTPRRSRDTATYDDPRRHAGGRSPYVLVNGVVVVDDGEAHRRAAPAARLTPALRLAVRSDRSARDRSRCPRVSLQVANQPMLGTGIASPRLAAELVDAGGAGVDVVDVEVHTRAALVAVGAVDRTALVLGEPGHVVLGRAAGILLELSSRRARPRTHGPSRCRPQESRREPSGLPCRSPLVVCGGVRAPFRLRRRTRREYQIDTQRESQPPSTTRSTCPLT